MSGPGRLSVGWVGGLVLLWFTVWWRQHTLWQGDPEMVFGWAVPFLVIFLVLERWRGLVPAAAPTQAGAFGSIPFWLGLALFPLTALFLEAFPTWTAMLWLQTAVATGLTLDVVRRLLGRSAARHFAFPVAFAFVALPWPAAVQQRLIPGLTTTIAQLGAVVLNETGHPALAHGNVIEVAHSWVGIEEACSGIRSLQCAVMVSLFLGEYLLLSAARRTGLFIAAAGSALAANFARVLFLSLQAAAGGSAAVAHWHDRAGDLTYVIAMAGIGLAAWLLYPARRPEPTVLRSTGVGSAPQGALASRRAWITGLVALGSVAAAYVWFESSPTARPLPWTFRSPTTARMYQPMPIPAESQAMLGCDQATGATWSGQDGTRFAAYFIHWGRGRSGENATLLHNPLICLPAAGAKLIGDEGQTPLTVGVAPADFHVVDFEQNGTPFAVAYTVAQTGLNPLANGDRLIERWRAVTSRQRGDEVQLLAVAEWGQTPFPVSALAAEVAQVTEGH